jgi:hypothetical protein
MAIDFFQRQESARRRTVQLVVYFVMAILVLIVLVYGLLLALGLYGTDKSVSWWQPELLLLVTAGVGLLVGGASVFKVAQLASGGQAVALMMGGMEVPRHDCRLAAETTAPRRRGDGHRRRRTGPSCLHFG